MFELKLPAREFFDERTNTFEKVNGMTLQLEHSLYSLSKWESKWKKPFLSSDKSTEEILDYIQCMSLSDEIIPDHILRTVTVDDYEQISKYISDPMTATTINDPTAKPSRDIITAELIYFWMFGSGVPIECEHWHLNKLITLIALIGIKNAPEKKMSKKDIYSRNKALNQSRRAKLGSRG